MFLIRTLPTFWGMMDFHFENMFFMFLIPQTELGSVGVLTVLVKGLETTNAPCAVILIDKNRYLVTPAVVSPRRNSRSRAQTSIFTIENQPFLTQMVPGASWPPDVSAESLEARSGP